MLCPRPTGAVKGKKIMNKITKVLFIIYSFIFVALIGFLIYINFFDSKIDFISNRHLVALIFAFLLGIVKYSKKKETMIYYM